jgi:diacylglycerol kinase (ATP)
MESCVVIWNPNSRRAGEFSSILDEMKGRPGFSVHVTSSREESIKVAAAAAGHARMVVAAGGDGTIHNVVNGLGTGSATRLHVLPLGTGNDFCRSMGLSLDPLQAAACLPECPSRSIDVLELRTNDERQLCVNLATGGNSVRVTDVLTDELKSSWGPWVFLRGAFEILASLENYRARIRFEDEPPEEYELWNFLAANGRFGAGGINVAPEASLDDGLMDVVLVKGGNVMDFAAVATEFFMGNYLQDPNVEFRRCRRAEFEVTPVTRMVCDGELQESSRFHLEVIPRAIHVSIGAMVEEV